MKNETTALAKSNAKKAIRNLYATSASLMAMASLTAAQVSAGGWNNTVNINTGAGDNPDGMVGSILGILLTITQYVGVALIVYGVYEVVMSFMQNQPEAKTKGIIMALAGAVMMGLKGILQNMGVINN